MDSIKTKNSTYATDFEELSCEVLVIGGGPGGYTAAFRAADLGKSVILVEKYSTLGGVCLNVGCIPSKALLHIAKVINDSNAAKEHGISFGKCQIDLDKVRGYKDKVVTNLTNGLKTLAQKRQVKQVIGYAKFTTENEVVIEVESSRAKGSKPIKVKFESAIIAVGSHAFIAPNFVTSDPRVITSTGALELKDIPKRMLVVGGGIIGLEMAEVYSSLGSSVTVVELGKQLIPGADPDLVKVLTNRIQKIYKNIYLGTKCTKLESKEDGVHVTLEGGALAKAQTQTFDKVLVATGRRPNGLELDAHLAKVNVSEDGFIKVDKHCRTNVKHIYAIGDVVGQPMLAHKATHEARVAAENTAGLTKICFDAKVIPSVAYTDPEISWVGITETMARSQNLDIEVGKFPWAASGRALGNGRSDGFTKIISDKLTKRVLGAGIVGVNAGELLAETALAIEMGCDIHDIALTIHAHPTLSESVGFACEIIDGSITDLYMPKK